MRYLHLSNVVCSNRREKAESLERKRKKRHLGADYRINKLSADMAWSPESNPGYIRGRRGPLPRHHLCSPKPKNKQRSEVFLFLIFSGEAVAYCSIKQAGIHLIFPPGAVPEDSLWTVRRWNPRFRSPVLFENEAVVSDVIELSLDRPGALHFDKTVTFVIPHCASNLKGYEVVVKCFSRDDDWKDVETADWRTIGGEKTVFFFWKFVLIFSVCWLTCSMLLAIFQSERTRR